jgi:maleylpyruvate isomerase
VTALESPTRFVELMLGGRGYFEARLATIDDETLARPVGLPHWTGKHLLAHVAGNARALSRLATWASTGEPTAMYAGPDERAREIEIEAVRPASALRAGVRTDQRALEDALDRLDQAAWASTVVTAQGREVEATVIPWLRSRELWIHGADLVGRGGFDDFPAAFLTELISDVLTWRRDARRELLDVRPVDGPRPDVPPRAVWLEGTSSDLARWLTGRGAHGVRNNDDSPVPTLAPWL